MTSTEAIRAARIEATRCRKAANPGTRAFWLRRLGNAAKQYEAAAAILRMQIAAIEAQP